MNNSKQTNTRSTVQESDTLRILRMKFHNYSKSQQISSVRPGAEQAMKSTLKENENSGWRQAVKSPLRNDSRYGVPTKFGFTQKSNNVNESEFTRKARELLARSLSKKAQPTTHNSNIMLSPGMSSNQSNGFVSAHLQQLGSSPALPMKAPPTTNRSQAPEKRYFNSTHQTRFQVPHDNWQRWIRQSLGRHNAQSKDILRTQRNVKSEVFSSEFSTKRASLPCSTNDTFWPSAKAILS